MAENSLNVGEPCNFQGREACRNCSIEGRLMCHFDVRDSVNFFMVILPAMVTAVIGIIQAGYAWHLPVWVAYWVFFFFVWEARVLCSHCPMWAEEGRVLRCHANYGVIKLWKYRPGPMSRAEQAQFIAGGLIGIGYALLLMALGGQWSWGVALVAALVSGTYNLRKISCSRCIHFSCPGNAVPKPVVDAYLRRNPVIRAAWEAAGYHID